MVIKNFIKKRDDFIECGHTIDEIIFAMNAKELNYLVLVQKGKPHGIITERDVLQLLYQKHFSLQASCCSICSRNLIKANGDRSLEYSLGLMIEERIRRLVIIDNDGFYLGVVEQEDIVYHFEAEIFNTRAKIKDFSHTISKAVTLNENVKTKRVIEVMNQKNIGSILVEKNGTPVGIVTETDLLRKSQDPNLDELLLKELMQKPLIFFKKEDTIDTVFSKIKDEKIRRIAIYNSDSSSYEVMTTRDIFRNLKGNYSKFLERRLFESKSSYDFMSELLIEIFELDNNYIVGWANEGAKKELGVSIEDSVLSFLPKNLWEETIAAFNKGSKNIEEYIEIRGKPFRYSASYSHLFGTKIIKILLSNMGKIHKLNLKLNEELGAIKISLAQKESMYKETFFQNTFGIAYADKDGLILDTNPHYAKMLGYEKDEIVGRNISEFTIFEDMQVSKSAFKNILKNQNHSQEKFEKRYIKRDGTILWIEASISANWDSDGKLRHIVGFVQDISQRYEAQKALATQEKLLSTVMNSITNFIFYKDKKGRYIGGNEAWLKNMGFELDEIYGKTDEELLPKEIALSFSKNDKEVLSSKKRVGFIEKVINKKGETFIHQAFKSPLIDEKNRVVGLVGVAYDITDKIEQEKSLLLAQSVFENTAEGIVVTDERQIISSVNPAFSKITGYDFFEAKGSHLALLSSNEYDREFYKAVWKRILKDGFWQGEVWNRRKNGETYPALVHISKIVDSKNKIINYIGTISDITPIKHAQEKLEFMAHHDPLTLLPNRLLLEARLEHAIGWAKRGNFKIAVLFLDLDHFKDVNDAYGHYIGDEILVEVAKRFKNLLRGRDTVARIGGDEFVLVLEDIKEDSMVDKVVNKILKTLEEPFIVKDLTFNITSSIGVALFPEDGEDLHTLIKNADAAMYKAKELGRNRHSYYTTAITNRLFQKLNLENELREAIKQNEFILYYQPQIDMRSGEIWGFEALARWNHPKKGIIYPDIFMPLAESSKLILQIGKKLIESACFSAKKINDLSSKRVKIAINISAVQMQHDDLYETILNATSKANLNPSFLELELTETYIMKNPNESAQIMQKLKNLGVTLAIDDFGIGYSSLSYLKLFPIDRLKIDKSFVRNIPKDISDIAISRAIIALAKSLGIGILAEGVEERAQEEFLIKEGCYLAQGYLYSKPKPLEQLIEKFIKKDKK